MKKTKILFYASLIGSLSYVSPSFAASDVVAQAKAFVLQATQEQIPWTGPTTGPSAQPHKLIVYVSSNQANGGPQEVSLAVKAAAKEIGWSYRMIDGKGDASDQNAAFSQAIALHPAGIIMGGLDAVQSRPMIQEAVAQHIVIVGWNAATTAGPLPAEHIFYNVAQDPKDIAKAAAYYAIAKSDGKANVVIFTTNEFSVALEKSNEMADVIKSCEGCSVLDVENVPLSSVQLRMPQVTAALLQKFGKKWNYSLAINDLYYDYMVPGLEAAGHQGSNPPYNISAGDGSKAAFQRIRSNTYQVATIAAPLELQGWQCVDELNRAFAGAPPAAEPDPVHIIDASTVLEDGGKKSLFNPNNGYKQIFKKIWHNS